jgi:hypothetical protein
MKLLLCISFIFFVVFSISCRSNLPLNNDANYEIAQEVGFPNEGFQALNTALLSIDRGSLYRLITVLQVDDIAYLLSKTSFTNSSSNEIWCITVDLDGLWHLSAYKNNDKWHIYVIPVDTIDIWKEIGCFS